MIATKRGKCASSRKLIVGKRMANARPFETVLLLPRYVMPTMISIELIFFFNSDQWVPQVEFVLLFGHK